MLIHPLGKCLITENFFVYSMTRHRPILETITKYQFFLFSGQIKRFIQRIDIIHFHLGGNGIPIHTPSPDHPLKKSTNSNPIQ